MRGHETARGINRGGELSFPSGNIIYSDHLPHPTHVRMLVASNGPILRRSQSPHWTEDRTNSRPNSRPPTPPPATGHDLGPRADFGAISPIHRFQLALRLGGGRRRPSKRRTVGLKRGSHRLLRPPPLELHEACSMPPVPRERPPMQHNRSSAGPAHPPLTRRLAPSSGF